MGFCLFNNVAVGALRAREVHGLARVAVIDFDVHHGNGTQVRFADDPGLFYGSTHQFPLYPGTGAPSETGVGNIVNVPLRPLAGSSEFRLGMTRTILPAHWLLGDGVYAGVTERIVEGARRHAGGRLIATLEGGYDLMALATSAAAHLRVLMSV
jgi:acetoin utilization deacetylase AcuC-like enzyme